MNYILQNISYQSLMQITLPKEKNDVNMKLSVIRSSIIRLLLLFLYLSNFIITSSCDAKNLTKNCLI